MIQPTKRTHYPSIQLEDLHPSPGNARKTYDEHALQDLASSITTIGLQQPLLITKRPEGGWTVIAGERRRRAAHLAKLTEVPAIALSNEQAKNSDHIALAENLLRENLNPYEETMAVLDYAITHLEQYPTWSQLLKRHESPRHVAAHTIHCLRRGLDGESELQSDGIDPKQFKDHLTPLLGQRNNMTLASFASNRLPLLSLPDDIKDACEKGLPYTKAKLIARVSDANQRAELLETAENQTVQQLQAIVKNLKPPKRRQGPEPTLQLRETTKQLTRKWKTLPPPTQRKATQLIKKLHALVATGANQP